MADQVGEADAGAVDGDSFARGADGGGVAETVFDQSLPAVGGDLALLDGVADPGEFDAGDGCVFNGGRRRVRLPRRRLTHRAPAHVSACPRNRTMR